MGLQFIEVVMGCEEEFGIELPDEDVGERIETGRMRTVADLHTMVMDALRRKEQVWVTPDACPTSAAFYRVRRALMEVLGVPRSSIRPATPMDDLITLDRRSEQWNRLFGEIGVCAPPLRVPQGPVTAGWLVFLAAMSVLAMAACLGPTPVVGILLLALIPLGLLAEWYRTPCPMLLPASCATVGGVSRYVAGRVWPGPEDQWTDEQVFQTLKHVLFDRLRINPKEVTMEASLEEIDALD
jgi:acyl carrier protein